MVAGTASQMRFLPEKLTRTVSLRRAFSGGSLSVRLQICMWKTQTLWQPVRMNTAMWAVLQVCAMAHPSKTARLRTPLWRADATTIITVREALWVIPPAEHLKSAPLKTTKLKRWLTAVVLSAKWMMAMESAILHLQTAMLQTVLWFLKPMIVREQVFRAVLLERLRIQHWLFKIAMCIRRRFLPWEMLCPREPAFLRATCGEAVRLLIQTATTERAE